MTIKLKNLRALFSDREVSEILGNSRQAVQKAGKFGNSDKAKLLMQAARAKMKHIIKEFGIIEQDYKKVVKNDKPGKTNGR